ncbi:hypothetical protein HG530_015254 [Fusarium avenaceum]|nr:hypothetical protein HG530_015254 [Fusarium avenaceum]
MQIVVLLTHIAPSCVATSNEPIPFDLPLSLFLLLFFDVFIIPLPNLLFRAVKLVLGCLFHPRLFSKFRIVLLFGGLGFVVRPLGLVQLIAKTVQILVLFIDHRLLLQFLFQKLLVELFQILSHFVPDGLLIVKLFPEGAACFLYLLGRDLPQSVYASLNTFLDCSEEIDVKSPFEVHIGTLECDLESSNVEVVDTGFDYRSTLVETSLELPLLVQELHFAFNLNTTLIYTYLGPVAMKVLLVVTSTSNQLTFDNRVVVCIDRSQNIPGSKLLLLLVVLLAVFLIVLLVVLRFSVFALLSTLDIHVVADRYFVADCLARCLLLLPGNNNKTRGIRRFLVTFLLVPLALFLVFVSLFFFTFLISTGFLVIFGVIFLLPFFRRCDKCQVVELKIKKVFCWNTLPDIP